MKKKPSIIILSQFFAPEMGAPQSRLLETAVGLQKLGWTVKIITALPNYPTGRIFATYGNRLSCKEKIYELDVYRYWLYASNSRKVIPRLVSMISFAFTSLFSIRILIRERPDYIFVESPPLLLGLSGLFLSKMSGAKLVFNISDLWPLSASELGVLHHTSPAYRTLEILEHFLYSQAFACTGQSTEITRYIGNRGAKRTLLFRNGVDIQRFNPTIKGLPKVPLRIVYAGLLGVAQGILNYCKNLDFYSNQLELHIYGTGPERKSIQEYLNQSAKKGIYLHEAVDRNSIPTTLCTYDLAFIPLIKPIFGAVPSKIYEAMAAGLPIIFAGGGEGANIVQEYDAGWVCPPSDFHSIQKVLSKLGDVTDEYILQKKYNCINAAREVFDREIQIRSLDYFLKTHLN